MASFLQPYELLDGATLTISFEADRPLTEAELTLLTRLAQVVERSEAWKSAGRA